MQYEIYKVQERRASHDVPVINANHPTAPRHCYSAPEPLLRSSTTSLSTTLPLLDQPWTPPAPPRCSDDNGGRRGCRGPGARPPRTWPRRAGATTGGRRPPFPRSASSSASSPWRSPRRRGRCSCCCSCRGPPNASARATSTATSPDACWYVRASTIDPFARFYLRLSSFIFYSMICTRIYIQKTTLMNVRTMCTNT